MDSIPADLFDNCWAWSDSLPNFPKGYSFKGALFDPGSEGQNREEFNALGESRLEDPYFSDMLPRKELQVLPVNAEEN